MTNPVLPQRFQDLEVYLPWALATERERSAKRQRTPYPELKAFYDAMLGRMEELLPYLDSYSEDDAPEALRPLFYLSLSLAEVAPAVEFFGQPSVVEGFDASRFLPVQVLPER